MNDEYLFEKTGNDDEIERLESALSVYSFQLGSVPTLSRAESPAPNPSVFNWFRISLAFGLAALVIVATVAVILIQRKSSTNDIAGDASHVVTNDQRFVAVTDSPDGQVPSLQVNNSNDAKDKMVSTPKLHRPPITKTVYRRPNTEHKRLLAREARPLTKEELYAYNQLKVALYIAGSKLKVVQDTINRTDDQKAGTKDNFR